MGQEKIADLVSPSSFSIESLPDSYCLHNVPYDGRASVVDISKELLDNGKYHKQEKWVALTREGPWRVPPGPLYHAVCSALHANRKHPDRSQRTLVTKVKKMLATDVKKYGMMTSTRIHYKSEEEDIVVHNFGYDDERRISQTIVGPWGYVNEGCGFDSAIEALLRTRDCGNVDAVYSWLSGKKPYLTRFTYKPQEKTQRSLVLDDHKFSIVAYDYRVVRCARGMVVQH